MTEIEFLDPGPPTGADPQPPEATDAGPSTDLRRWLPTLGAAVAWLAAAGLAVAASLGVVYRLVYASDGTSQSVAVDAWGRFNNDQLSGQLGHGTRYAIVLVAAAVLLLAAALVSVVRPAIARLIGLVGLGAAAAMATTLFLQVESTSSTYAARQEQLAQQTDGSTAFTLTVHTGSAAWLALAAALLALLGAGLALLARPPAAGTETVDERDAADEPDGTDAAEPPAEAGRTAD